MENKTIIANPLYDTAFKYLMENMETARFFCIIEIQTYCKKKKLDR